MITSYSSSMNVGSRIILSLVLSIQITNTRKDTYIINPKTFLFEEKNYEKNFESISLLSKSITISLVYVSQLKKNVSYFSLFSHTLSLCFTNKQKSFFFFFCLTYTNYLSQRRQHLALSSLTFFSSSFSFPHSSHCLSFKRGQEFALSSLTFFSSSFSFQHQTKPTNSP